MQESIVRTNRRSRLSVDQYDVGNQFLGWFAAYHKRGAARCVDRKGAPGLAAGDIFMGPLASRRFSIGLADDKVPVLGIADEDVEAVMSLNWAAAAFVRRVQRNDWIALSCPDARIEGSSAQGAVSVRLWLPCTDGLLDGWVGIEKRPTTLRVVAAQIRRGKPEPKTGSPLALLPLSFVGNWDADSKNQAA